MNEPVSPGTIRATIMAGTVASDKQAGEAFPPAADPACPEPSWSERIIAAAAPDVPAAEPRIALPPVSALPIHQQSVAELCSAYAQTVLDPRDVLDALLARIAQHPSGRDAVLRLHAGAAAQAAESAARLRSGTARRLEGIFFGVKDIIDVGGTMVTCGSLQTGERIAPRDATIVARLRQHGAIPIATLATTEFACGSAHNPRYGAVRNPWNRARWTGGSSTGSGAALAARLMPLALGTDTGGSIRAPAAWCGITGLKPTRGLVPRTGVAPLSWTLDHIGPMARSAADLALVMPLIAGPDGEDVLSIGRYAPERAISDLHGLRIGVPDGWFLELQDEAVVAAWREALQVFEKAGARLVDVALGDIGSVHTDGYTILMCELASLQEPDADRMAAFDPGTRARIEQGQTYRATDYLRALRRRPLVQTRILAALKDVDVLVTPGLGSEAAALDTLTASVNGTDHPLQMILPRNTMVFDYVGLPALMLPSGRGRTGMPVAIQIVGKLFDDALCLAVGEVFQRLTDHQVMAPPEA